MPTAKVLQIVNYSSATKGLAQILVVTSAMVAPREHKRVWQKQSISCHHSLACYQMTAPYPYEYSDELGGYTSSNPYNGVLQGTETAPLTMQHPRLPTAIIKW